MSESFAMVPEIFDIRYGARVEVIIDGQHLHSVGRALNLDIDFLKLKKLFSSQFDCRRIHFLMKTLHDETGAISNPNHARLLDFLRYNGYTTLVGATRERVDATGRRIVRQSVDVAIACLMMKATTHADDIILFAGSEDLAIAAEACMDNGKRVIVVSSKKTAPVMVAQDLRATVDHFVDLTDLASLIERFDHEPNTSIAERISNQVQDATDDRQGGSLRARARITSKA